MVILGRPAFHTVTRTFMVTFSLYCKLGNLCLLWTNMRPGRKGGDRSRFTVISCEYYWSNIPHCLLWRTNKWNLTSTPPHWLARTFTNLFPVGISDPDLFLSLYEYHLKSLNLMILIQDLRSQLFFSQGNLENLIHCIGRFLWHLGRGLRLKYWKM